jgi:hypothetical protein
MPRAPFGGTFMPFATLVAVLLLAAATGTPSPPPEARHVFFPRVTGQNLNGKTFNLPNDFQGPASFVFVAFTRGQQAQVDSWKTSVAQARARYPKVGEYEVPTLSRGNAFFRGFIDGGMRNGIRDTATRDVTITLYIDKRPFDASLGIASEDEIVVLLVRPDGTILWRASGAYEPAKEAGSEAALAALPQ